MKRVFALLVVPVAAFSLAACGGDDSGDSTAAPSATASAPATGRHNDQDVMFAQMMIPHHQQAIEMSRLAAARASAPEVKQLAAAIEKAQDPEIKQLTGWLNGWSATAPSPGDDMSGMDHGDGGMDHGGTGGMMSAQDMRKLENSSGKAFDKMFLEMMIEHHEGAVAMARTEQTTGQFPAAKTMADNIADSQTAEITKMRNLLKAM